MISCLFCFFIDNGFSIHLNATKYCETSLEAVKLRKNTHVTVTNRNRRHTHIKEDASFLIFIQTLLTLFDKLSLKFDTVKSKNNLFNCKKNQEKIATHATLGPKRS